MVLSNLLKKETIIKKEGLNTMVELFVYKTKITDNKDPRNTKSWDKYKVSYKGFNFDMYFTEECRKTFEYEVKEFPITLSVEDDDYFLKKKTYKRNDGTNGSKWVMVISGYEKFTKAEFKKRTIDDVVDELMAEDKGDE